jgi:predicted nicotinamide N-methyase
MDEEIESIFEDGLLSLFDHHPVAFSTPSPSHPYIYRPSSVPLPSLGSSGNHDGQSLDLEIPVYLPVAPSALHSTLQLTHIWLSSIFMADLIFFSHIDVRSLRICELGAGAGLPSVAALLNVGAEAGSVVSTDYAVPEQDLQAEDGRAQPEDVLGVLRGNLRKASEMPNLRNDRGKGKGRSDRWAVVGHTWGEPVTEILNAALSNPTPGSALSSIPSSKSASIAPEQFDLLLLADLLWSSSSHTDLLTSVHSLLKPKTGIAHVIAGLHQGRGATDRFKSCWKKLGGWVEEVLEVRWGREGWETFERRKDGEVVGDEERGVIVWFKIGR